MRNRALSLSLPLVAALLLAPAASAVNIEWVTVAAPGNVAAETGFGLVAYTYQISKYEVTNTQYAEFLNAVAAADPNGLYVTSMGSGVGGISRSGSSGSFTYSALASRGNMPVNYISFYDSIRFANWLHNGQPTGAQGSSTTEDGAYTITAAGISANSIARNAGATIFLTSENEWYKAAYYEAVSGSYYEFPAGSDVQTDCDSPGAGANTANCAYGDLTDVGSYTGSPSPWGTFDQGGNVFEWNESTSGAYRRIKGGGYRHGPLFLAASWVYGDPPTNEEDYYGFRVAQIPEPGTGLLVMTGLLVLVYRQRRHGCVTYDTVAPGLS